jgi:outer membrane scaffolding protein for murein synthesis (MipA/OmpV family)
MSGVTVGRYPFVLAVVILSLMSLMYAEGHHSDENGKNWIVMVGAVGEYAPSFVGSDDHEWSPIPLIIARYWWPRACAYIEGDKMAFEVKALRDLPLSVAVGLSLGKSRDEDLNPVLHGMGNIRNDVQGFGEVMYGPEWLSAHARLRYAPVQRNSESFRHAFLSDLFLESEIEAIPLILRGEAGVTVMDKTWSSLHYGGGSGLEAAYLTIDAMVMLSHHFGLFAQGGVTRLLGDASTSVVSIEDTQLRTMLGAFVFF